VGEVTPDPFHAKRRTTPMAECAVTGRRFLALQTSEMYNPSCLKMEDHFYF